MCSLEGKKNFRNIFTKTYEKKVHLCRKKSIFPLFFFCIIPNLCRNLCRGATPKLVFFMHKFQNRNLCMKKTQKNLVFFCESTLVFISVVFVKSQYFLGSKSISSDKSEALFWHFFRPSSRSKIIHRNTSKNPRARKQEKQQQQHALTKEELARTHTHTVFCWFPTREEERGWGVVPTAARRGRHLWCV